ncbi:ABC transporter ATP-binding protein [Roseinatronobacter bogoriensis]|uniref:ABC transporter ATP-binding protein n=1 Tax=Roseinatronobacter bogoriensis subsp. barguzinensis TaxID=441209 RepID=A0A2K8KD55_9RHOB|nr:MULTISPECIES: ABC transporter ATP-binding protein [Rhodobaca]ATX67379.1 ABC transporter ATP-binding protein [Rhodobaca barguzinensis]MBB4206953.1 putative ABC transport system ATP-binding protein [Rhodobaca bogoriensis DSM 18756]TDW41696.1 putative ABC transport system ATP-binding protein [Rhodobaca barguzinensis]TDY74125.1 putative ABC transport system ATP-binding protein [Rhodobaca bogoriensis DSM 18756]
MTALTLQEICKSFDTAEGKVAVLKSVSLRLEMGQSLALTGESGSGKSTLLHIAAGLEHPDSGRVMVGADDMTAMGDSGRARLRRGQVGLIFQQFNLIPSLNVAANLGFQARLAGVHDAAFVTELAARLGLDALMRRYPEQLSGGQQQRVAIGRCLAARPALVLADEPTGNLDEATGDQVLDLMLRLTAEAGAALLLVTHSERLAARCDTRAHLRAGQIAAAQ